MGGARSGVTESTRALFLESAYFRAGAISGTARALGLQTESSQRFERGVDYALQRRALERATELLLAIVGGKAGPVVESQSMRFLPKPRALRLRASRVTRILGVALKRQESEKILRPLGMRVARAGVDLRVTPPSYRFDVQREEDVIEELARLHGYERLPARLPAALLAARPVSESVLSMSRLRRLVVDRDYHEVITYSFVDPALARMLDPAEEPIILANPIAADMAAMRTSLWPGLIQALRYNRNRQQARVRLFEIGRRFRQRSEAPVEDVVLAGVAVGSALPTQWGSAAREMDFFDAKGDVEALLSLTGRPYELSPAAHPALHPGQTAAISLDGRSVGMLGMLHPEIRAELGLEGAVYLFELGTAEGFIARLPSFGETSKFPSIRRDLAVIVPESVEARLVLATAARVAGKLLVNLELFDQYRGKGIDSGRKSLALGLTLQDSSRTLKDDEVEALIAKIVSTLESELGAQLRR
jgi:phenylalanyl-tRNA synthetase beta chain